MSVVTTLVAVPNRIESVVEHLRRSTRESSGTLSQLISPRTLNAGEAVPNGVLGESRRLGLIDTDADNNWQLTDEAAKADDIQALVTRILLTPDTAVRAEQERVGRAIAWFLTRDVHEPLPIGANWHRLVQTDCPTADNAFDLTNPDRCRQFAYWVAYLGFGWRLASTKRDVLVPDPTVALGSAFRATLNPNESVPISDAIGRVADICPVIEGGSVREDVERQLVGDRRRTDGQFSRSTSFALTRLVEQGVIEMPPPPSDARVMTLDLWPEPRSVSHIRLCEGQQ